MTLRNIFTASGSAFLALAMLTGSIQAQTPVTTTLINDSFANGFDDGGTGQEAAIYSTTSGAALGADTTVTGPLDFATGGSGRTIHTNFTPTTLSSVGDSLEVTFDFTTPATVDSSGLPGAPTAGNEVLRFGLFNTAPAIGTLDPNNDNEPIDFFSDISASGNNPQPAYNLLPGFSGEFDDFNTDGSDIGIRTADVNGFGADNGLSDPQTGTLINSNGGFDQVDGGVNDGLIDLVPNTDYGARLFVELNNPGEFDITVQFLDGAGTVVDSTTDTVLIADSLMGGDGNPEVGVNTSTFDFFTIHATSGAFGSSSTVGEPDNGIDISNITINSTTSSAIPEPSSLALLFGGLSSLLMARRRKI